jgi:hypothetical protein
MRSSSDRMCVSRYKCTIESCVGSVLWSRANLLSKCAIHAAANARAGTPESRAGLRASWQVRQVSHLIGAASGLTATRSG